MAEFGRLLLLSRYEGDAGPTRVLCQCVAMSQDHMPSAVRPAIRTLWRPLCVVVTIAALVGLAACGDDGSDSTATTAKPRSRPSSSVAPATGGLAGTSWKLNDPAESTTPTLDFAAAGRFSGSTGCNQIAGTYTEKGDSLTFSPGPMTQRACISDATHQQEQRIVAALSEVRSFTRTEDSLSLLDASGKELLAYSAVSGDLAGTSWKITGVNTGNAVESSALTEALTLQFGTDGTVSGNGGCNQFNGPYTQDGTTISFGEMASTMMGCSDDVLALEDQYLAALAAATKVERSGDSLTLRDDAGAMQVTAALSG